MKGHKSRDRLSRPVSWMRMVRVVWGLLFVALLCSVALPAAVSAQDSRIEPAIAWAQARRGSHDWDYMCLAFVCDAYQYGAGTSVTRYYSAKVAANTLNAASRKGTPAPRGSFVFYDYWDDGENLGHAGISLGDGTMIHAYGSSGVVVTTQAISLNNIGWAPPPVSPPMTDFGQGPPPEGSFIQVSGSAAIYRIAGGAPLYVSNWNNVGGPQPYTVISQTQFNALRSVPADNTFIAAAGHVYRIAGGAPLYVSTWTAFGGAKPCITVDGWVIDNITHPAAHLNARPSNGTLVSSTATGRVYVIAGGAPTYVSDWANIGGARPSVGIDQWDLDNITNPLAHLNARPSDGTYISTPVDGRCYVTAGGAPLYISTWDAVGGPKSCVAIDKWAIDNWSDPAAHLNTVPSDGTLVRSSGDGRVYIIAGGAPVYVSDMAAIGGTRSVVGIDKWCIDNISDPHAHLRAFPAEGIWLRAGSATEPLEFFVVAGSAPIAMGNAAMFLSAWAARTSVPPTICDVDVWSIDHAGEAPSHMRAVPADGTIVRGLPSDVYWSFTSGQRKAEADSASAVWVADFGLADYPIADTTGPVTHARRTSGLKGRIIRLRYMVTDDLSSQVTHVRIVVRNRAGRIVKTYRPGTRATDTWYAARWRPLKRGTYYYRVYAKDLAGNVQSVVGRARVIVR